MLLVDDHVWDDDSDDDDGGGGGPEDDYYCDAGTVDTEKPKKTKAPPRNEHPFPHRGHEEAEEDDCEHTRDVHDVQLRDVE